MRSKVWLILTVVIAAAVAWAAFILLRGGTVYMPRPDGYTAFSPGGGDELRPVPRDRYDRILRRFIRGDLFDSLWIAHQPKDGQGGLTLHLDGDEVEMEVSFLSLKDPDRLAAFRKSMKSRGYAAAKEDPWNVGLGQDLESVTLEYRFKKDLDGIRKAVEGALDKEDGPAGDEVYVYVWRSQDGPGGTGIKVVLRKDVLAEVP